MLSTLGDCELAAGERCKCAFVANPNVLLLRPGAIARSVAMSLGNQEAPRSILASGTSFCEDLVMEIFLRPFFLFR